MKLYELKHIKRMKEKAEFSPEYNFIDQSGFLNPEQTMQLVNYIVNNWGESIEDFAGNDINFLLDFDESKIFWSVREVTDKYEYDKIKSIRFIFAANDCENCGHERNNGNCPVCGC